MYILASNMWFTKLIRQFFFWLDQIVFNFISIVYDLLITIARTSVFTQTDFNEMSDRIYKLLAVFMVFKVTLSLISYVVNPDDFSDKTKGVSKLSTNMVISLALLILTPYLFNYAYQFQTIILEDNSLGTLIFGGNEANESFFNTAGDKIAYTSLTPFFSPNVSIGENMHHCTVLTSLDSSGKHKINSDCAGALTALQNDNFSEQTRKNYISGVENANLGLMFRLDMVQATNKEGTEFIMDYKFVFSTAVGVIIILLLITFCMDVAVRSIKLACLQLIAPVPIISYIDPKSGKDGMFKKWYEMCFKTFLSLFVRLLALYFAVFIISKVADMQLVDVVDGSYVRNPIIYVFIIIGALMFAKDLPKMLEGLGIKLDGDGKFFLNPLKKLEEQAIGGKKISGFMKAAPAAGLAGAAAFGTNLIARKGNVFSAAAGALSATGRGLRGAVKGEKFGKNFSNSYSGAMKARVNRADRKELGINAFDVARENMLSSMNIANAAVKNKVQLEHLKEYSSSGKAAKTRAEGEVDKKAAMITVDGKNLGALRDKYELLKNAQVNRSDYIKNGIFDQNAYQQAVDAQAQAAADANAEYFKARKKAVNAYVDNASKLDKNLIELKDENGKIIASVGGFDSAFSGVAAHDEIVVSNVGKMEQLNEDHGMNQPVDTTDIGATVQRSDDAVSKIEGSREYRQAELISKQAQKEKNSK